MINPKTYQQKEPEFNCDCGWQGVKSNLLTKKQFLKKQRKLKIKLLNLIS